MQFLASSLPPANGVIRSSALVLCLALVACTTAAPPTQPSQQPQPPSIPALQQPIPRSANALTATTNARTIAEPRIKVGMLSDQTAVTFPRIAGGYYLITDAGASTLRRGFTVTAPLSEVTTRYAVQVSAISDETSANELADKLRAENAGLRVDVLFDPAGGVRRVIAGDFPTQAAASPLREQLTARGYGQNLLIVRRPTDQPFEKKLLFADDEGDTNAFSAGSLLVLPATAETVLIDDKPYRGGARVFINSRGLFNVVNELNLEDYLRGVVPAELGSKIYDELEAQKVQAVAARTYAIRNLGQFRTDGYDICPGPACQA